jgi:type IV secretion system protein VirD4
VDTAFNKHGSAHFSTTEELERAGLINNGELHLGFTHERHPRPIGFDSDAPLLCIGPAGVGKFVTTLIYMMIKRGLKIVNDSKGEIAATTKCSSFAEKYYFNLYGLHSGAPWFIPSHHRFNFLDFADPNSPTFFEDMLSLAMNHTNKPKGGGNSVHFYNKAVEVMTGLMMYGKEINKHFSMPDLYNVMGDIQGGGDTDYFADMHYPQMIKSRFSYVRNLAGELKTKLEKGGAEFSGIMSTISSSLSAYGSPAMQFACSGPSTITIGELLKNDKDRELFFMIPAEYQERCGPIIRAFICAISIVQQRNPRGQLHICLDEAGQISRGGFEALPRLCSFGRGSQTFMSTFWQDRAQLDACLGKDDANTVVSNSQKKIILGAGSHHTAKFVRDNILGETTHHYIAPSKYVGADYKRAHAIREVLNGGDIGKALTEIEEQQALMHAPESVSRPLLTEDEIMHIPPNMGILDIQGIGIRPYLFSKIPYFENRAIAHRFLPNPYHPPYDRIFIPSWFGRKRSVEIISERVPEAIAHLPQYSGGYWSYPKGFCPLSRKFFSRTNR